MRFLGVELGADDIARADDGGDIARVIDMGEAFGGVGHAEGVAMHEIGVIAGLHALPWTPGVCMNVNFPAVAPADCGPLTLTRQGVGRVRDIRVESRVDPRHVGYAWLDFDRGDIADGPESEAVVVHKRRAVSATPLSLERTNPVAFEAMRTALG